MSALTSACLDPKRPLRRDERAPRPAHSDSSDDEAAATGAAGADDFALFREEDALRGDAARLPAALALRFGAARLALVLFAAVRLVVFFGVAARLVVRFAAVLLAGFFATFAAFAAAGFFAVLVTFFAGFFAAVFLAAICDPPISGRLEAPRARPARPRLTDVAPPILPRIVMVKENLARS